MGTRTRDSGAVAPPVHLGPLSGITHGGVQKRCKSTPAQIRQQEGRCHRVLLAEGDDFHGEDAIEQPDDHQRERTRPGPPASCWPPAYARSWRTRASLSTASPESPGTCLHST